ncbi:hypothetical protein [Streptomyces sp. NBC_00459]|uniref:hypothetical protein n=1 Tax=Streptomyces sp. NBC_00459 TaxID=2975749 RepID=UPI002E189129
MAHGGAGIRSARSPAATDGGTGTVADGPGDPAPTAASPAAPSDPGAIGAPLTPPSRTSAVPVDPVLISSSPENHL